MRLTAIELTRLQSLITDKQRSVEAARQAYHSVKGGSLTPRYLKMWQAETNELMLMEAAYNAHTKVYQVHSR